MKYSIIIVAYKDYSNLDKCLASIASSGIRDYEVVIWDNTPLKEQKRRSHDGSAEPLWFTNGTNKGFAAGCNLGANYAHGDILIFLNPDTQVFGNWADDMAAGLLGDVAAVGPVSNYVAGLQQAARYGGEDKGFVETRLLIGFCLMIREATFLDLGGMDERFFLGCDDLDLSWRIQRADYRMMIATGVFVHHEGRTSMEMNPEKDALIKASENAMREKLLEFYGENPPSSEEIWGCKILATSLKAMRLSLCMIVESEERANKLRLDYATTADQVVVHVAGKVESFAEARNTALSKCIGDWVLWIDSDDSISRENWGLIHALIHRPGNNVALQACHFAFKVENIGEDGKPYQSFHQPRLFPRLPGLEWGGVGGCYGFVHESYFDKATALGLPMVLTNITIQHHGYANRSVAESKQARNLALLEKEPDNTFKFFNVGTSYLDMQDYAAAVGAFEASLSLSAGEDPGFIGNIQYSLGISRLRQGNAAAAVEEFRKSNKPDALFMLGLSLIDEGEVEEGCDFLWKYLKMGDIVDVFGTHCPVFRKNALDRLAQIGVLAA